MKKIFLMVLVSALAISTLAGCGQSKSPATTNDPAPTPNPTTSTPSSGDGIVKLGMGHITSIGSSKDLAGDVLPVGQVDTVVVAAGFDKDGKVVSVSIDSVQTKVNFDKDLKLASDINAEYKSKVELGDAYGMAKASSIKKEWHQQADELGKWMVGKTVEEIKGVKMKDDSVPDAPELTSVVTIKIKDYVAAVEEAYNTAVDINSAVKVGLGHTISIAKSKGLDGDVLPLAQVDTVLAATAFDTDGKVAGVLIDSAQTKVNFDKDGKVTSDKNAEYKTKVELGDAYGMAKASGIKKEWYQQADELGKWMVGKTIDEIKGMKVNEKSAPDVAELSSLVTISVQDYIAAVAEAYDNAK